MADNTQYYKSGYSAQDAYNKAKAAADAGTGPAIKHVLPTYSGPQTTWQESGTFGQPEGGKSYGDLVKAMGQEQPGQQPSSGGGAPAAPAAMASQSMQDQLRAGLPMPAPVWQGAPAGAQAPQAPGVPSAVNIPNAPTIPGYQSYNFNRQSVQPNSALTQLSTQLAQRMANQAPIDVAGQKEQAKESLTSMFGQQGDALKRSMAARGREAGSMGGAESSLMGALPGALTSAYRDIDENAQRENFARLAQSAGLAGQLGQQKFERGLGAGQFDVSQQALEQGQSQAANQYGLQKGLGEGDLLARLAGLDVNQNLGLGGLAQQQYGTQVNRELGLGNIAANRYGSDVQRELGLGNLNLGRGELAEKMRQFDLGLADTQAARSAAAGQAAASRSLAEANQAARMQSDFLNLLLPFLVP